jgi:WD repeat-containing protein 48
MVAHPRRISYVLPSPASPPPLLSLPPLAHPRDGHPGPLLFPKAKDPSRPPSPVYPHQTLGSRNPFLPAASIPHSLSESTAGHEEEAAHPQHCLSVASLAVDTSTQLQGHAEPQGILYTGGRDGLVAGWELGIKQTKRRVPRYHPLSRTFSGSGTSGRVRWERLTGQEDDDYSDDEDDDRDRSSEDSGESGHQGQSRRVEIPYEEQWEVDREEYSLGSKVRQGRCHGNRHPDNSCSLRRQHSANLCRHTLIGSMPCCYAT